MSAPTGADGPRPTAGASRTALEERLQQIRRELARRDEDPTGAWVEESAADLASGAKAGWYFPGSAEGGLAFFARQGDAAFGHLHTERGLGHARLLAGALLASLPEEVRSLDLGFTGLPAEEERRLVDELVTTPGSTAIAREAMERPLSAADAHLRAEPPAGTERVPVSAVTVDALAELDRAAFAGAVDALLLGRDPLAHRRSVEMMLAGRLGPFLEEASSAVLASDPTRLLGVILCGERSSRRAIVLDVMVDPGHRRQGLGAYLLGYSLRALWALGYQSVGLWVSVGNEAAIELYHRFGFRTTLAATIYRWDRPGASAHPHASR